MSPNIDLGFHPGPRAQLASHTSRRGALPVVQQVYDFIVEYKREHDGNSPTIREIGDACKITSTSVVIYWLIRLENQGFIRRPEPAMGNRYAAKIEVIGGKWRIEEK
jgi:SOS-response transcriptional repressor LexA